MIKIDDLSKIAILVDFDGTITTEDTNIKLMKVYSNDKIQNIRNMYKNGEINFLKLMELEYKEIKITEKEYLKFILEEFHITEGFVQFYNRIKEKNIPFGVVSGGFDNGIKPFLEKYGITDVDIYANSFIFDKDNISVKFYDGGILDCCDFGPCGNCKIRRYEEYKRNNDTVIFIGDGFTDRWVAQIADVVFAKDGLLTYCKDNNIDYIPWNDFHDISELIFGTEK